MLSTGDALELIARTGYDGVELAIMPDWPAEPRLLSAHDRATLRGMLTDHSLQVPALLETLRAVDPIQSRAENLDRARRAVELGVDLAPDDPPLLETVLGRKPNEWEAVKYELVEEVGEWTMIAASGRTVICFKPHVGHAVNNAERSIWLIEQVGSPYLRCTYDYSHLWLAGLDLAGSLERLLPVCPYLHLKDAKRMSGGHRFVLPGEGSTDYVELFRFLRARGYGGFANVEVSSQVHRQDDYQPIATARICYERMSVAMERAGLRRS